MFFSSCKRASNTTENNNQKIDTLENNTNLNKKNTDYLLAEATEIEEEKCVPSELDAYLNDSDSIGTNICDKPGGNVVTQLIKDAKNYEYFLTLTSAKNGWFKLKNPIDGMQGDIEIPNGQIIGTVDNSYLGLSIGFVIGSKKSSE